MLTPTLKNPSDLLNKLYREQHRALHAQHSTHVADHLYNFCVTSVALRDHLFKRVRMKKPAQEEFNKRWNEDPVRVACNEIANTMKHSKSRQESATKSAKTTRYQVVNVYVGPRGELFTVPTTGPTLMVLLSDHTTVDSFELTSAVINFWREYFQERHVAYDAQPTAEFFGTPETD